MRGWRGWQAPALQALLLQTLAAGIILIIAVGLPRLFSNEISFGEAAVLQGVLAALLTAWRRLARWWIVIQLLFPVALLTTVALQMPPLMFLGGFLFLLLLFWSTFRTQVPFYPSGPPVREAVHALLPTDRALRCIDIGSGLGDLVLALAARRPDSHFIGIELAPLPWLISVVKARLRRSAAQFIRGDYDALDFEQFDVVFAYLSPAAMPALWQKVQREMRPGSLLLSYEFPVEGEPPQLTVLPHPQGPLLYGWRR